MTKAVRVKFSRIQTDLNHYQKNCEIPGIKEVDKVTLGISVGEDEGDFELDEGEDVGGMDGVIDSCFVGETEG